MRGIDLFCASQASTAICLSMDHASSSSSTLSSSSTILLGGRAIDRHNPIIGDGRRFTRSLPTPPCSSLPSPINPKPYHQLQKTKKSSPSDRSSSDQTNEHSTDQKKKTSSKRTSDLHKKTSTKTSEVERRKSSSDIPADVKKKGYDKPGELITPPGSSRYLLSDTAFIDGLTDYDPVLALVPVEPNKKTPAVKQDESIAPKPSSSSHHSEKPSSSNQVVVLRVSLHCKGCAGKLRKHLSRMEGVSSFNIDFAAKKVTIVGDVTPLSVLASVSKVKNAQFWPAAPPPSPSPSAVVSGVNQEVKK